MDIIEGGKRPSQDDQSALMPYLGTPFDKLPEPALYQIIVESGLTIAQMHRLCALNHRFGEICKKSGVWKRTFIDRFVKKRGDKRNLRKFEEWAGEPLVEFWDRRVANEPNLTGFTHLVVCSIVAKQHSNAGFAPQLKLPRGDGSFYKASFDRTLREDLGEVGNHYEGLYVPMLVLEHINHPRTPTDEFRRWILEELSNHCHLTELGVLDHGEVRSQVVSVRMLTPAMETTACVATYMLKLGAFGAEDAKRVPLVNACVICAAPATMQCAGCEKIYCSHGCARTE